MKIDLHVHSTASDGKLSPEELVDLAIERNVSAIAITDHDVVSGSKRAIEYAKDKNIEIVPGVEIGADDFEVDICDVHILGLFLDLEDEGLTELSRGSMKAREIQKKRMIERLSEFGYEITFEELKKEANGVNYGRPHIARILMRKYNDFESIQDVFDELLGYSGKASVRQEKVTIKEAIDIIHGAGGVAVLAHPMLYSKRGIVMKRFVECGGDGIEVDYFYGNRDAREKEILDMIKEAGDFAKKEGLAVSGGGDFHSDDGVCELGDYGINENEFERLKGFWKGKFG